MAGIVGVIKLWLNVPIKNMFTRREGEVGGGGGGGGGGKAYRTI